MLPFLARLGPAQRLLRALCRLRSPQAAPSYGCDNSDRAPTSGANASAITGGKGTVMAFDTLNGRSKRWLSRYRPLGKVIILLVNKNLDLPWGSIGFSR